MKEKLIKLKKRSTEDVEVIMFQNRARTLIKKVFIGLDKTKRHRYSYYVTNIFYYYDRIEKVTTKTTGLNSAIKRAQETHNIRNKQMIDSNTTINWGEYDDDTKRIS